MGEKSRYRYAPIGSSACHLKAPARSTDWIDVIDLTDVVMQYLSQICYFCLKFLFMDHLFLFNPDNEMAVANGNVYYTPPASITFMMNDLAFLPAYFAGRGDHILVPERLDFQFIESRREIFGMEDMTVTWKEIGTSHFNELRPWGWSARIHKVLEELKPRCSEVFRQSVMAEWEDERRDLYGRLKAKECLERMRSWMTDLDDQIVPSVCTTVGAIWEITDRESIVVKAPWSSSGNGVYFIRQGKMTGKDAEIVSGMLRRQGYVMVEKRLNRILDFAMEFEVDRFFKVRFLGFSVFTTGNRGEYKGNYIGPQSRMIEMIGEYVGEAYLENVKASVGRTLEEMFQEKYIGCLGVDMMIYLDDQGEYRVQPCVEINLRYNMGIVSLCLQRYLVDDAEGCFRIRFAGRDGEIVRSVSEYQQEYPLEAREGKIIAGYVNLTPVIPTTRFVAELFVGIPDIS